LKKRGGSVEQVGNFIEHYGKKGMKWGVRRSKGSKASKKGPSKKRVQPKSAKELSDDDLRKAINRMNMEKQYTDLVKSRNKSPNRAVSNFILGVGSTAVKGAVTGLATQQVSAVLKKATKT
jgi:hypothetical protein